MSDNIRVLIVDDLPETRENVRKLLQFEPDIEVIGQAGTGEQAIEMATINGAKTMGMEDEIGSLEAGKKADIVIFDTNTLEWRPLYNEVQALVYSANANMVEAVFIDGKLVVAKGKVLTVDEKPILAKLREREEDIKDRIKIPISGPWTFI